MIVRTWLAVHNILHKNTPHVSYDVIPCLALPVSAICPYSNATHTRKYFGRHQVERFACWHSNC